MLKRNTWCGFSNEPVISSSGSLSTACKLRWEHSLNWGTAAPTAPCFLCFTSLSHKTHSVLSVSQWCIHRHTCARTHTHTEINSHQYGRGQAIRWEVTLQMSRQLQGQRTYFFPAGAFLMGCRGRQRHTRGGDKKRVEQPIRIGVDNKPIIPDRLELTNTTWGREAFWGISEVAVLQSQVRN